MIVTYHCPECGREVRGDLTPDSHEASCDACGHVSRIPPVQAGPGVVLAGRFRIDAPIRSSSVGYVFRGTDLDSDSPVFVKILPRDATEDEDALARFQREARIAAGITHPSLLSAIDAGEDNGVPYLITPYRDGRTLAEVLKKRGTLPEIDLLRIVIPICRGLQCMWDQGQLVHRNVKPETILLPQEGDPVLTDLGIARSFSEEESGVTRGGLTVGTPQYMAPEACLSHPDLDYRLDMYALGIVMYQALAGAPPFDHHSPMVVMRQQVEEQPPPLATRVPDVSPGTADLIHRLIAKSRHDRPDTWQTVIDTLIALHQKLKITPGGASAPPKPATDRDQARSIGATTAVTVTDPDARPKKKAPQVDRAAIAARARAHQDAKKKAKGSPLKTVIIVLIVFILIAAGVYAYVSHAQTDDPSTDDPASYAPTGPQSQNDATQPHGRQSPDGADSSGPDAGAEDRMTSTAQSVITIMLGPDQAVAPALADALLADPQYAQWTDELSQLKRLANAVAKSDQIVLASFDQQSGQQLRIRLRDETVSLRIRDTEGGLIRAEQVYENGHIGKKITVADLHIDEILMRLGDQLDAEDADIQPALFAIILQRRGRHDRAIATLQPESSWLTTLVASGIADATPSQP